MYWYVRVSDLTSSGPQRHKVLFRAGASLGGEVFPEPLPETVGPIPQPLLAFFVIQRNKPKQIKTSPEC